MLLVLMPFLGYKDALKRAVRENFIDSEELECSMDDLFTNDTKRYQEGREWWQQPFYGNAINHFPVQLEENKEYEFQYNPPILQGGAAIALKIPFETSDNAKDFFSAIDLDTTGVEFENRKAYDDSWYCNPIEFGFESLYQLPLNSSIKLIKPIWCIGQGDRELGGILAGVAWDKDNNTVVCWAIDSSH